MAAQKVLLNRRHESDLTLSNCRRTLGYPRVSTGERRKSSPTVLPVTSYGDQEERLGGDDRQPDGSGERRASRYPERRDGAGDAWSSDARGGEMRTSETRSEGSEGSHGAPYSADVPTSPVPAMEGYGGEPVAPRRPAKNDGDGIYRTSRPALGALLVVVAIIAGILVARLVLIGIFGAHPNASDALGGLFGVIGIPLFTAGLYAVLTGAASPITQFGPRIWLRTPLIYLPIGILLFIAAGMAA
jgi:hypothetical protein